MKNIMIIDGAENCVYDVFGVPDDDFVLIFPDGTDVAFIEDVVRRPNAERVVEASKRAWSNRIPRREAAGIHGTVFYELYGSAGPTRGCGMRKLSTLTGLRFGSPRLMLARDEGGRAAWVSL